ncbi:MAG: hypothetical protein ACRDNZ_04280 [Streptosporangiaceae bacterium]
MPVAELTMGEPGQQVSLDDSDVADDGRRAIHHALQVAESLGRAAIRQADHRAGFSP